MRDPERPSPDCTGNPELWPWAVWERELREKVVCATPECGRKPGKVVGTTSEEMAPFCQTCRMRLRRESPIPYRRIRKVAPAET